MNDDLFTGDLDVASVQTRGELAALLRTVHTFADRPSLRALEARTRHDSTPLSKTVVSEMLKGNRFPRKAVMASFLSTCGVSGEMMQPWLRAWERVAVSEQDPAPYRLAGERDQPVGDHAHATRAAVHGYAGKPQTSSAVHATRGAITTQEPEEEARQDTAGEQVPAREVRGPVVRRRELGSLLRGLRINSEMTIEQVASNLLCSPSKVSRMETGYRSVTLRDIRDLCDLYGVADAVQRDHLMELAREGRRQGWWQSYDLPFATYVGLEADATTINCYHATIVAGLLQTADYARAITECSSGLPVASEWIDQQVTVRLTRQRILIQESPPKLHVIMDEAALRRIIGQPAVMKAQLDYIAERADLPNVTIQVIPYDAGAYPALDSSFRILDFPSPMPGIVYVEGLFGFIYLERAQDVERYRRTFQSTQSTAASEKESIKLIRKLSRELNDRI